jgi:prepilin-type N-terminal cleavage/methylation domain-containing protein
MTLLLALILAEVLNRPMVHSGLLRSYKNNNAEFYPDGFTIVELLVVIVVIGILAAISIVSYTGITGKATATSLQSDLANAAIQLKMFQVDNSNFPDTISTNCQTTPDTSTNKCLKLSSGNSYTYYQANNSISPQTFSLHAGKSNVYYRITNNSIATVLTAAVASGGTVTTDGAYRVHKFTSSGTLTVTTPGDAEVLVVGGGGGGASGGGGAGGYLIGSETLSGSMTVTVGAGGTAGVGTWPGTAGTDGGDSVFGTRTSKGGGKGAMTETDGTSGASGGGGGSHTGLSRSGGIATPSGQGFSGGSSNGAVPLPAGGGGGAGGLGGNGVGSVGGTGGIGLYSDIVLKGTNVGYAGGGGGGIYYNGNTGGAASHGGGAGGSTTGTAGVANTGGGGGGASNSYAAGAGGSGIVIIRYLIP